MFPLDFRELRIEVFLDFFDIRMISEIEHPCLLIPFGVFPPSHGGLAHLSTEREIVHLVPGYSLDATIETSMVVALLRAESHMFPIGLLCSDESSVTWSVSTIFAIISLLPCIEAFTDRRMCLSISDLSRNTTVESIEIPEPIPIIVLIHILHDTSLE